MMNTESWAEIPFKLRTMQWYQLSLLLPTALFLFRDLSIWKRTLKHETEMRLTFRETKNGAWRPLQEAKAMDWSGKGQMWFLTVVAFTPPPSTSTFPLLQRYCLHSVICLDSLCKWLPRSCNPNVHFFFVDFPSTKLNVNFIPYFIFQTPQHFVCYFLYKWARFPLNRVLSYHGYVTGACGYQWRHSQA